MIPDFLILSAPPWQEVENASVLVNMYGMDSQTFAENASLNDFNTITQWAEEAGLLVSPQQVTSARLVDVGAESPGEVNVRIWIIVE